MPWNRRQVAEFLGFLGTGIGIGYLSRLLGRELLKGVPVLGQTLGVAYGASASGATTFAWGKAAGYYLRTVRRGERLDSATLRAIYGQAITTGLALLQREGKAAPRATLINLRLKPRDWLYLIAPLLWLVPVVALLPLGAWWLWQSGYVFGWRGALLGCTALGLGLQTWLRRRGRHLLAAHQTQPGLDPPRPGRRGGPRGPWPRPSDRRTGPWMKASGASATRPWNGWRGPTTRSGRSPCWS